MIFYHPQNLMNTVKSLLLTASWIVVISKVNNWRGFITICMTGLDQDMMQKNLTL